MGPTSFHIFSAAHAPSLPQILRKGCLENLHLSILQEEERLAAIQAGVLKAPLEGRTTVGMLASERLSQALEALWLSVSARNRYAQLLNTAQHLGLHKGHLPPPLYKVSLTAFPLPIKSARVALCAVFV